VLLKNLPPDARPREKMLARGAAALSDAELLALLLRTGIQGKNVLLLAQEIIDRFGSISGLLNAPANALSGIKGLGPAKQSELIAVLELSRRALAQQLQARPVFDTPLDMQNYVRLMIGAKTHEVFVALFLDAKNHLISFEELFRGTLSTTSVYPREVVMRVLHHGAAHVVLAHNHPSGGVEPSQADLVLTKHLKAALHLIDVQVLDHVIVSSSAALSMAERGLL
jgi:DNA repair protein RadC